MNRLAPYALLAAPFLVVAGEAAARDQIRIVGSSTVFPFATAAAETFGRDTDFATPVIESTGTGGGFKLFCAGVGVDHPDFSNASRPIKDGEVENCAANGVKDITEITLGYDGIVLANSKDGPDIALTRAQIFQALAAEVEVDGVVVPNPHENWSDIDPSLPDAKIEVLGPPPTSGTRDAFVELVMEEACEEFEAIAALEDELKETVCATMREDGAFVEAGENDNLIVQKLQANSAALGIFGFSFLDQNLDSLKGATIEGVAPEFESIADGSYPVSRSLFIYAKNDHVGVIPGMAEFVDELTSEAAAGQEGYLTDKGLIPLPQEAYAAMREAAVNFTPMGQ